MYAVAMSETTVTPVTDSMAADKATMLVQRVADVRDKQALAELFGLYGPRVKSMMLKLGADNALAEDLVQETFINVWRKAGLYSNQRGTVSTWVFTIARNLRIDHLRRQSSKPYEDLEGIDVASDAPAGAAVIEQHEIVQRVTGALASLSPEQREVVQLSFVQELPHSEIAERIGIPLGTVKSRLRLAYDRLRPMLEDLQ